MSELAATSAPINGFVAVIPAGGVGSRLWPLSRPERPKFLLDLLGTGSTLIQDTVSRLAPIAERTVVVTGAAHIDAVRAQLAGLDPESVLAEPSPRDSMAAIALAAAVIEERHGPQVMGSFAADHVIRKPDAFRTAVTTAVGAARGGAVVLLGIEPTEPSTAFGYVQAGAPVSAGDDAAAGFAPPNNDAAADFAPPNNDAASGGQRVLAVEAFTEKPDAERAAAMIAEGNFFWNAGMYVVKTDVLLGHLGRLRPDMLAGVRRIAAAWDTPGRADALAADWERLDKIAIDHAIAEPVAAEGGMQVVPASLDWFDVGDFAALAELLTPGPDGIISVGRTAASGTVDATGAMVVGGDKPVVIVGLDDVVVVDTPEAILVLGRAAAQRVKDAASQI